MITFSDARWDTLGGHDYDQRRLLGFGLMLGGIALFKILCRPSQLVEPAARFLGLSSRPIRRLLKLSAFRQIR